MDTEYFENNHGTGILSTADADGRVNSALYARPHTFEDGTIAFIMADRLSRANLSANPHASYLFLEEGQGYRGKRLHLTKVGEEQDKSKIEDLRRRTYSPKDEERIGELALVYFEIDRELPLLGAGPRN